MNKAEKFIKEMHDLYEITQKNMDCGPVTEEQLQKTMDQHVTVYNNEHVVTICNKIEQSIDDNNIKCFLEKCNDLLDLEYVNKFCFDSRFYLIFRYVHLLKESRYSFCDALISADIIREHYILSLLFDIELDRIIKQLKMKSRITLEEEINLRKDIATESESINFGYLDYYKSHNLYNKECKLRYIDYEKMLDSLFWFPRALLGTKLKHIPNKKYSDEIFEHCWNEIHVEGRHVEKAIELTLAKYELPMEIHGFKQQYYVNLRKRGKK